MSGFILHIGGNFVSEPNLDYVGGKVIEWSSATLNNMSWTELMKIIYQARDGDMISVHYKKPVEAIVSGLKNVTSEEDVRSLVKTWAEAGSVDVYVVEIVNGDVRVIDLNDDAAYDGDNSDDDDLRDVGYASEDDDELDEYITGSRGYVAKIMNQVPEFNPDRVVVDVTGDVSDPEMELKSDEFDNSDLDWSMTDEDGFIDDSGTEQSISQATSTQTSQPHSSQVVDPIPRDDLPQVRRKSSKTYYNPKRHRFALNMIFSGPPEFRQAIIEAQRQADEDALREAEDLIAAEEAAANYGSPSTPPSMNARGSPSPPPPPPAPAPPSPPVITSKKYAPKRKDVSGGSQSGLDQLPVTPRRQRNKTVKSPNRRLMMDFSARAVHNEARAVPNDKPITLVALLDKLKKKKQNKSTSNATIGQSSTNMPSFNTGSSQLGVKLFKENRM